MALNQKLPICPGCKGLTFSLLLCLIFLPATVRAKDANYPELNDEDEFSLMGALSDLGLHDMKNERWNFYSQLTYITQSTEPFRAAYTDLNGTPNSLSPHSKHSFTATSTSYFGIKAWEGGEFYASPEMISETPFSGLKGLGGDIQNFELQKNGSVSANWYVARVYYRHTLGLGGKTETVDSAPLQLAGTKDSRRLVITAGNLSILDIFDKNEYAGDLRHQFFNMGFMANSAYDFAADLHGYSWGLAGEYYWDDWTFRFGRFITPAVPNGTALDFDILNFYGDQAEIEHRHVFKGLPGAIRILGFRNRENMAKFTDAIAAFQVDANKNAANCTSFSYGNPNSSAPDLCWARKANIKMGVGINMEQSITKDIGLFFRGMYNDGQTEQYSYTSADRSLSAGGIIKGVRWGRPADSVGLGYAMSWISKQHAAFLNQGGIDGFIGDGRINAAAEQVLDIYYQCHVFTSTWVSVDYQHLSNPAYNADRGPVDIYGARVHVEF